MGKSEIVKHLENKAGYLLDFNILKMSPEPVCDFTGLIKFSTRYAHEKLYTMGLNGIHFVLQNKTGITRVGWFPDVLLENREGLTKAMLELKSLALSTYALSVAIASKKHIGDEAVNTDDVEIFGITSQSSMAMYFAKKCLSESKLCAPHLVKQCTSEWVQIVQKGLSIV